MQGKWQKAPAWLVELFDRVLPLDPRIERRLMFGYPAAFANGHMFTGLFQASLLVRLDEAERSQLLALEGAVQFEPMPGRPMREYVVVPPDLLEDPDAVTTWIKRGLTFVAALPPKAAKAKPSKAAKAKPSAAAKAKPAAAAKVKPATAAKAKPATAAKARPSKAAKAKPRAGTKTKPPAKKKR